MVVLRALVLIHGKPAAWSPNARLGTSKGVCSLPLLKG
jgi:hypothetical protein